MVQGEFLNGFSRFEFWVFLLLDQLPYQGYLPGEKIFRFLPFPRILALCEIQTVSEAPQVLWLPSLENRPGDPSSISGWGCLHIYTYMYYIILVKKNHIIAKIFINAMKFNICWFASGIERLEENQWAAAAAAAITHWWGINVLLILVSCASSVGKSSQSERESNLSAPTHSEDVYSKSNSSKSDGSTR